ncbi:hypothetical protein TanjilG_01563 [Lupinus angustifolius]|uniref:uncharacterized protein LOC109335213 n=1 Tax=Lupinus angustifolius TaxID=3871 RepID=UPI00090E4C6B|nr:PREDICTED: uncharacterized protein LOC109335213 [Lupinus angustifolius]OIV90109.1 hypothetical protein TanjilG_01563 [Lupinus angustifolius]
MASSSTFSNLLSLIIPTKQPSIPPPPNNLNFPFSSTPFQKISSLSHHSSSVMNPSLAYSNMMLFKSAYNVQVVVGDDETEERLLNRFRREVMKAGVIQECKRRRYYENKHDKKKRKAREASRRNRKWRPFQRTAVPNKDGFPTKKGDDDDDDNWDLPEGDTAI